MHVPDLRQRLEIERQKIEQSLKLATHNPTIGILFKTVRVEIKFAFVVAFSSIFLLKLYPDFFDSDTLSYIVKDIWEKICYSIVASGIATINWTFS
jgi:hypothetical protein